MTDDEMVGWLMDMSLCDHFANMCITLIDMWILNHTCVPGMNPSGLWCMILLMYCQICFAHILLNIFTSVFISYMDL